MKKKNYTANRATPQQTKSAAPQRRPSTFSCRKSFAASALVTKESEAAAGTTRLTSAQERANSKVKKAKAIKPTAIATLGLKTTRRATTKIPSRRRKAERSPI